MITEAPDLWFHRWALPLVLGWSSVWTSKIEISFFYFCQGFDGSSTLKNFWVPFARRCVAVVNDLYAQVGKKSTICFSENDPITPYARQNLVIFGFILPFTTFHVL